MAEKEVMVNESRVDIFISLDDDDRQIDTVITNPQLAAAYFAPLVLFSLDKWRHISVKDPSSIISSEYWDHHRTIRTQFKDLDPNTQALWSTKSSKHLHRQP